VAERFAAFTLDELEAHSNAFEELVIRGMHLAVDRSVERAYDQGVIVAAPVSDTPEDETPDVAPAEFLAFIRQYWGEYVAEVLIPWLLELMNTAGQAQFTGLANAFNINITPDTPADDPARGVFTPELIDQPLASERYLAQASNRLVRVGDDLWERARTELNEGIENGESIPQLAERVQEAASLEENRSRVTARTEANGAANTSAYQVNQRVDDLFPEVDGGISKQWSATDDLRTRQSHRDADGQVVGLDEPFRVGTASLAYPSDPEGPPGETIQCRCTMLTVISDEVIALAGGTPATPETASSYQEEEVPYDIVKGGGDCADSEWAVVKQGTGESVGCHETEESAQDQVAAIMASEAEANGESSDSPDQTGARSSTSGFDVAPVDQPTGDTDVDRGRFATWSGVIAVEGVPTGDGRQFEHGALTWADLPMPLGWMYERAHGGMATDKVVTVGMIDEIERGEGGIIVARGRIDLRTERGWDVASMMGTREQPGSLAGVSIDADDPEDPMGLDVEYVFPEGCELPDASAEAADDTAEDAVEDVELDMKCMMPELAIYHSGRIRAATIVDIPAFVEARIYLDQPLDDGDEGELHDVVSVEDSEDEVLTAASYTMTLTDIPPASWFDEPTEEPDIGAITVTDEGRIFGYLAPKHVAHRGIRDKRVEVPMKNVDYGIWMNRVTIADDGHGGFSRIATGPITMDCGHAPMSNRVVGAARRAHYDNSCSVVATARVGENARGVWIAGAILPDVTPEQVRRMMTLQLSGDWGPHREQPGKRELAGALLVPVPGYPKRSFSTMSVQKGVLNRVTVPLRFAVSTGTHEQRQERTFGIRRAADRIAASIGRDRMSRVHELATRVRGDSHGV
jgi:hypothetical protein